MSHGNSRLLIASSILFCHFAYSCKQRDTGSKLEEARANYNPVDLYANSDPGQARYIANNLVESKWFGEFSHTRSTGDVKTDVGIPYIIFRLLPVVAKDVWPGDDAFLNRLGLVPEERNKGFPFNKGIGWTGMANRPGSVTGAAAIDQVTVNCAACHTQRVWNHKTGKMLYLDGASNTEMNSYAYFKARSDTLESLVRLTGIARDANGHFDDEAVIQKIIGALKEVMKSDFITSNPNYFYKNYRLNAGKELSKVFDADYEAKQKQLFVENIDVLVRNLYNNLRTEQFGLRLLKFKNYNDPSKHVSMFSLNLDDKVGIPGQVDATGLSTAINSTAGLIKILRDKAAAEGKPFFLTDTIEFLMKAPSEKLLAQIPDASSTTDIMVVWNQQNRSGGQWNGNIPISFYRNLAAALTPGIGAAVDRRMSMGAADFLKGLPAPKYPFGINQNLAAKGKAIFEQNCSECHRPNNSEVYDLGSPLNRAKVITPTIHATAHQNLHKYCSVNPKIKYMTSKGEVEGDCSVQAGKEVKPEDTILLQKNGYNALPLDGIWAQAPYFVNGSSPTMYHVLVPSERPRKFTRGTISYDEKNLGFSWQPQQVNSKVDKFAMEVTLDKDGMTPEGHDKDITYADGKVKYRLNWDWKNLPEPQATQRKEEVDALIEYMKTM
ncbi:MAG: hypothetical protein NT027_18915 [Proteobacteria bacterium]|nr:hypothetical protein [Pseudomonadota bacterium]